MLQEECIELKNDENLTLRGILHHGDGSQYKNASIVCLNTGLNDMVGWYRLQVKMARFLASQGYNVLRFDDWGMGDSDGEILEESIVTIFSQIETGLFVPDADAAVDFLANKFSKEKLIYLGFCGGALTALHSAARNKKIAGVIDVGGPVTLSSKDYLDKKDPWEVGKNVQKYRSKLLQLRPWLRFFSGRGEYKTVFTSITRFLRYKMNGLYQDSPKQNSSPTVSNLNTRFFHSFQAYAKTARPALFYFAELDSATWEFKKYFLSKYKDTDLWSYGNCTFIEVERANHIFSGSDSQETLKNDICNWLKTVSS